MGLRAEVPEGDGPDLAERAEAKRRLLAPPTDPEAGETSHPSKRALASARTQALLDGHDVAARDAVVFGAPDEEFSRDWYPEDEKVSVRERLRRWRRTWRRPGVGRRRRGVEDCRQDHRRRVLQR